MIYTVNKLKKKKKPQPYHPNQALTINLAQTNPTH